MPAISTRENSSKQCADFIDAAQTKQQLYVGLGQRATAWAGDPLQVENTPEEKTNFWTELLGIKKVAVRDVIPMIIDRKWATGITYELFDETNEYAYDDAFYVITSNYEVFLTNAVVGASTTEPTKALSGIALADGNTWDYMFTVNRYAYQQTPTGWLAVNYGSSYDTTDLLQDKDAFIKLSPQYITVRVKIEDPNLVAEFTVGEFRQVGLISDPRLLSEAYAINTYEPVANLLSKSGYLTYLENRAAEDIVIGQNTDLKITLRFQ